MYICNDFCHISESKGHLQSQTCDGAARAASCSIPVINIAGMGCMCGFQWYRYFGGSFLLQKTSRLRRKSARWCSGARKIRVQKIGFVAFGGSYEAKLLHTDFSHQRGRKRCFLFINFKTPHHTCAGMTGQSGKRKRCLIFLPINFIAEIPRTVSKPYQSRITSASPPHHLRIKVPL